MDDLKSQAAVAEYNVIIQSLTQRCVNLAAENAVLRAARQDATAALERLKAEKAATKDAGKRK